MKDFNIGLNSLEELVGKDDLFKMSKSGMVNFFNNLSIFVTNYNTLKNELIYIFNRCASEGINPGDACSKCRTSLERLENINYIAPNFSNNIFTFKEMNLFVDVNRKLIINISDIIGIVDQCISEFNDSVSDEKNKINIEEFPIAPHSYEGEGELIGSWNVIGKKDVVNSSYTTNGAFFVYDYGDPNMLFANLINGQYLKGDRELGLLLYDQFQIYTALQELNGFIEKLKDKLLYCPLNFKSYKEKNFEIDGGPITTKTFSFDSLKNIVSISMTDSSAFYIEDTTNQPSVNWSITTESKETILSSQITCAYTGNGMYKGYYSYQKKSIIVKSQELTFISEVDTTYKDAYWGVGSSSRILIIIEYVDQFKIESFD